MFDKGQNYWILHLLITELNDDMKVAQDINVSVLPSMPKACRPNKPSVQSFLWCGNRNYPRALMWPQAPPKLYLPVMP